MNREDKILKLVDNDIEDIRNSDTWDFVNNILRGGWKGYEQMTTKELNAEFKDRFGDE